MIYVAVTPPLVWIVLLLMAAGWAVVALRSDKGVRFPAVPIAIVALQIGLALAALAFTAERSISSAACLTGIIGSQGMMAFILALVVTAVVLLVAKGRAFLAEARGRGAVIASFAAVQILVLLVLMRSAVLCTV